jgi:hypothetical protein
MKFSRSSLFRLMTGLVGLVLAPLVLHAQQTIVATAGQVGVAYSYQVTSNATPPVQYGASGLPTGLAINASSGLITGTPTTPGTVVGNVSVTSGGQTNNAAISITIAAAAGTPVITSATTASGTVGVAFTYNSAASISPTSYNITGLPTGLSANSTTGVINGTPVAAGASSISLSANNANGTGAAVTLTLTVAAPAAAPVVTSASNASVAVGAAFSYTIIATNTPTSFAAAGLPLGLSVDTVTGAITGTPTVAGIYTVGLSAANAGGTSATFNLALTVGALSAITSPTTSTAAVGLAYTYTVTASPAATSFNVSGLPAGLSANTTTGAITGTPTVAGVSSVSLSANNATGSGPVTTLTLTIGNLSSVTSATSASGTVGIPFSYTITASNSPTGFAATGLPAGLAVNTTTGLISGTPTTVGSSSVSLSATNTFGTGSSTTLTISIVAPPVVNTRPVFIANPQSASAAIGGNVSLSATVTGTPAPSYQWRKDGINLAGATSAALTLSNLQVSDAGTYVLVATNIAGSATSSAAVVGVTSTAKVVGSAVIVATGIVHPNGNVYDQLLLTGNAATITADANKVTRISFIDLNDDIVQVEMSGAGAVTLSLDNSSGPATPVKYNQSVNYMKGHASLVITGANATTNLSIFSVGTGNAVDQTLFKAGVTYDGVADIGLISITSTDGKFAAIRTADASYFAVAGSTGIYAPGVAVTGPVYIEDISADVSATPVMVFGSTTDVRITGGDLLQLNNSAIQVDGITQVNFTAGTKSSGQVLPAQANLGRFVKNGVDVTSQLVHP